MTVEHVEKVLPQLVGLRSREKPGSHVVLLSQTITKDRLIELADLSQHCF